VADASEPRRGPFYLLYPEYGAIDSLVGFAMFYLVLDTLSPTLVDALATVLPSVAPDAIGTGLALLLWLVAGVTALAIVVPQVQANPHRFETRRERDAFLDANRPSATQYQFWLALLALGGAVSVLAWQTFIDVLGALLPFVIELDGALPSTLSPANLAVFVLFVVGFAAYSRGLDRLVVGVLRDLLYRSTVDEWE
jgi:hypothetical protein